MSDATSTPSLPLAPLPVEPVLTLYGFSTCPHCASLKSYLEEHALPFATVDVEDAEERQRLYDAWELEGSARSMPQLRIEGVSLGGNAEVRATPVELIAALAAG